MFLQQTKIDISPTLGVDLCGFANRPQPSGVLLDSLYCKALLLDSQDGEVLLIQFDLIGLTTQHSLEIRQHVAALLNLSVSQVQIFCSHTHSGPCTLPLLACGSFHADYIEWLIDELPKQLTSQLKMTARVNVYPNWDRVRTDLGSHRRGSQKNPASAFIRILSFRDQQHDVVSILLNYAMHPVGLKGDQMSADYPGYLTRAVEEALPGHPLCLFSLGPCGDIDPPAVGTDLREIKQWTRRMSKPILDSLHKNLPQLRGDKFEPDHLIQISQSHQVLKWPVEGTDSKSIQDWKDRFLANEEAVSEFGPNYLQAVDTWQQHRQNDLKNCRPASMEIILNKVVLGDISLGLVNAEIFSSVLSYIQDERTMLITLANGAEGYLPDKAQYEIGGYETDQSFLFYDQFKPMPGALEALGKLFT